MVDYGQVLQQAIQQASWQAHQRATAERQQDMNARKWLRENLSASQMLRFQERVHGIHKRLEQVLARNGH